MILQQYFTATLLVALPLAAQGQKELIIPFTNPSFEDIPKTFIITSDLEKEAAKQKDALGPLQTGFAVSYFTATEIFDAITQQTLPLRVTTEAE